METATKDSVTFLGEMVLLPGNVWERYFETVAQFNGHWVVVAQGWIRWGKANLIYEYEYNPNWSPSEGESPNGYPLGNGYHTVYKDFALFIEECKVRDRDIIDGVPRPAWAVKRLSGTPWGEDDAVLAT